MWVIQVHYRYVHSKKNNYKFLSPAHEVWAGDIVITMSGRAAVRLCVCVSFQDDISETISQIAFIYLHTSLRGCRCAFDFEAIIDCNWFRW